MRILVTGAAGFIGRHLMRLLESSGHIVKPLDRVLGENTAAWSGCDIADLSMVTYSSRNCDGIIHLASLSRERYGREQPLEAVRVNILGTATVLEAARTSEQHPWVILGSTRDVPVNNFAHASLYGLSWRAAEEIGRRYALDYGLRVLALRLSDVYGPGDYPDKALPSIMRCRAKGDRFSLIQDRLCDFTHVDDVARAFRMAAEWCQRQAVPSFEAVTICTGVQTRLSALVGCAPSSVQAISNDPRPAETLLGFRTTIPLEKGLLMTWPTTLQSKR